MDYIGPIVLFSCMISASLSFQQKNFHGQNEFTAQRRQEVSYTTSIIHEDPNNPDQLAQSSVNVDFNPKQLETRQIYPTNYYNQQPNHYLNNQDSQLFNVGYSVSFKNPQQIKHQPIKPKPNLDNGEIITGTRKQNEQVDAPNLSPQEYVSNALQEKVHKISGIKPKTKLTQSFVQLNTKQLLSKANLSPTTQKYFKALENTNIPPSNQEAKQQLQQNYSWRSLSPSVEIVRSSEIPVSARFNHDNALGRSESFDFTNALESNNKEDNNKPQRSLQELPPVTNPVQPQVVDFKASPLISENRNIKFPIDTRLLREPIITTDSQNIPTNNPNVIPIHFDIRPIQEVMKNQLQQQPAFYHIIPAVAQQKSPVPAYFQTQPEMVQIPSSTVVYQNAYKIYGKPQPVMKNYHHNFKMRQPRVTVGEEIQTDLRPPPITQTRFQRRNTYIVY